MAKINIASVTNGGSVYTALIVLTETHTVDGQELPFPLGEATITFPHDTPMEDVRDKIIDTAQNIMKAHQNARDKKADLEELELPDIT